ncbi:hypothetical protein Psuf_050710 [Phytohabitans suffuscus]|uniref:Serine aminopeptidase S33 domain-containing protein n=1 Tax=Phytohabitans suffuscus TaxID=624315 RepID=A0A6F8YPE2_9ACTN|nr:hypothetical protein Psuf_050710 [Phytohabitans suffuscus]
MGAPPHHPDTDLDDRVEALDRALAADPEPAVLVATSLGCLTVARWAAARTGPVAAALLTVPRTCRSPWPACRFARSWSAAATTST